MDNADFLRKDVYFNLLDCTAEICKDPLNVGHAGCAVDVLDEDLRFTGTAPFCRHVGEADAQRSVLAKIPKNREIKWQTTMNRLEYLVGACESLWPIGIRKGEGESQVPQMVNI